VHTDDEAAAHRFEPPRKGVRVRPVLRSAIVAALLTVVTALPSGLGAEAMTKLSVRTGQSVLIPAGGLVRAAIGDPKIAGILPIGNVELIVNGKMPGRTSLFVWTKTGRQNFDLVVIDQNLEDLRRMIQTSVNDPAVHVAGFGTSIVLDGNVATGEQLVHLGEVLARYEPIVATNKYSVVNAVTVAQPLGVLQSELASDPSTAGVRVDRDLKGNMIVSGPVPDRMTAEHVLARVRALAGPYLAIDGKVVDRLESATISQVDVKVYILEVDETALRDLGINLQSASFNGGTYALGPAQFPLVESPASAGIAGRALTLGGFFRTFTLAPTLDLILQSGHARVLSSPDLVTLPGREASFLVGGQIPVPFASGAQQVAIVYKDFGVQLKVTPTILGDGAIETIIAPEVSDLDFQDGVSLNGFVVPAFKTSRLSTDVITKSGESIVMGGLLRRVESRNVNKIPLLGDLPILGKLFRSTRYQSQQTDLVFVMTPTVLTR